MSSTLWFYFIFFHRDFSPSIDLHVHGYYFKLMDANVQKKNTVWRLKVESKGSVWGIKTGNVRRILPRLKNEWRCAQVVVPIHHTRRIRLTKARGRKFDRMWHHNRKFVTSIDRWIIKLLAAERCLLELTFERYNSCDALWPVVKPLKRQIRIKIDEHFADLKSTAFVIV